MGIEIILLVFLGFSMGVNRIAHRESFEKKHPKWMAEHFPGYKAPPKVQCREESVAQP